MHIFYCFIICKWPLLSSRPSSLFVLEYVCLVVDSSTLMLPISHFYNTPSHCNNRCWKIVVFWWHSILHLISQPHYTSEKEKPLYLTSIPYIFDTHAVVHRYMQPRSHASFESNLSAHVSLVLIIYLLCRTIVLFAFTELCQ